MSNEPLLIGLFADNLRLPVRDGLRKTAELGVPSFQIGTTGGEMLPENMSKAQRAEFKKFYEDLGLKLSATCADFGLGFLNAEKNKELVPKTIQQVDMAVDLGTKIITTHVGTIPETPDESWDIARTALNEIGKYAEDKGINFATETGPESGPVLKSFLDSLDTKAVRVNLDPANLTMAGFDLYEALDALRPYIVHTHAKDGFVDPGKWREAPLGKGDIDWPKYIAKLRSFGYKGAFTIERELGEDPIADIKMAIEFLRQF